MLRLHLFIFTNFERHSRSHVRVICQQQTQGFTNLKKIKIGLCIHNGPALYALDGRLQ